MTILLALDGSEKDERGIAGAAALAALSDCGVRVVRIVAEPTDRLGVLTQALTATDEATRSYRGIERELETAAEHLWSTLRREVTWEVVTGADVAEKLLRQIDEHHVDFVVLATRAAGAVGRAIHGSVADHLVRESRRPVLLMPPRAGHLAGQPLHFRRVLVPFDGSSAALRVMDHLLALAHADTLELVLFQAVTPERTGGHVMPPGAGGDGSADEEWTHVGAEVAEQRLLALAEPLRRRGSSVEVRVVESPRPAEVILDAVRGELVELIAMTTRGAGGLQRLVLGSVAEVVARGSEVPVLLVTARTESRG